MAKVFCCILFVALGFVVILGDLNERTSSLDANEKIHFLERRAPNKNYPRKKIVREKKSEKSINRKAKAKKHDQSQTNGKLNDGSSANSNRVNKGQSDGESGKFGRNWDSGETNYKKEINVNIDKRVQKKMEKGTGKKMPKIRKTPEKRVKVRTEQTSRDITDVCANKLIEYAKRSLAKARSIENQVNDYYNFEETQTKKAKKSGDFDSTKDTLLSALGGDSSNPTCNGEPIAGESSAAKSALETLEACHADIDVACGGLATATLSDKDTLDNCFDYATTFRAEFKACVTTEDSTTICNCLDNDIDAANFAKLMDSTLCDTVFTRQKRDNSRDAKDECLDVLKLCKAAQIDAIDAVDTCKEKTKCGGLSTASLPPAPVPAQTPAPGPTLATASPPGPASTAASGPLTTAGVCESIAYNILSDLTRDVDYYDSYNYCDQLGGSPDWQGPGWYRFPNFGRMPETKPETHRCNTQAPGWIDGTHPTDIGVAKNVKICFHYWSGNGCTWSNYASVINCGNFYLYKLENTQWCNMRYCSEVADGQQRSLPKFISLEGKKGNTPNNTKGEETGNGTVFTDGTW